MKKSLLSLAILCFSSSVLAGTVTNVVKLVGYGQEGEDGFEVKATKGYIYIYGPGIDSKSAKILHKAVDTKSCVKIKQTTDMITIVEKVPCPKVLKPIKQ